MSGLIFQVEEKGANKVAATLKRGARSGRDTRVVMDRIVLDMMRVERTIFSSEGRRGGGGWRGLKPDTIKRRGGSTAILRTHDVKPGYAKYGPDALYRSLTETGTPFQILNVTRNTVRFGTSRPYAAVQQSGGGRTPARPFMRFLPSDEGRWANMIAEHLMKPFIEASD